MSADLRLLAHLEYERKLERLSPELLAPERLREAQVEAVIDALLMLWADGDASAYAHARHVGEWSARIAAALPCGPGATFMRRCGVLAGVCPAVLARLPEVAAYASGVEQFQAFAMSGPRSDVEISAAALIIAVADDFDSRIFVGATNGRVAPREALQAMYAHADEQTRSILEALLHVTDRGKWRRDAAL